MLFDALDYLLLSLLLSLLDESPNVLFNFCRLIGLVGGRGCQVFRNGIGVHQVQAVEARVNRLVFGIHHVFLAIHVLLELGLMQVNGWVV